MITRIMAALRIPPIQGTAAIWVSTVKRRLQVTLPGDAGTLDIEHTGRRGVAGGYASLNGSALVPTSQLGTGTADATTFLRGDGTWAAGGGGGSSDHATLSHLGWTASGHTGTANRVAGFDGSGAAAYLTGRDVCNFVLTTRGDMMYRDATEATRLTIGAANRLLMSNGTDPAWASPADVRTALDLATYYQAADAGLTSLTAADASAGLPYVSGANTWASATYSGMLSVVSAAWKVVGLRESGGTDLGMGAVADGEVLRRSGTTVAGSTAATIVSDAAGGNGLVTRTSAGVVTARTVVSSDSTVTITNPGGVAGNIDLSTAAGSSAAYIAASVPCGSGISGDVTFDGTSSVSGFGAPSSRVYTCPTGPEFEYNDVTIDTSGGDVTVIPAGTLMRCRSLTITGSGTVYFLSSGSNASGTTAGAGGAVASSSCFFAGQSGPAGRTTAGAGIAGTGTTAGVSLGRDGLAGAGAQDTVTARNGGTAGTATRNYSITPAAYGSLTQFAVQGYFGINTSVSRTIYPGYGSPASGGAAAQPGAGGTVASGGSGGSGCPQVWCIGTLNTGTATLIISAAGGNGANATTSVNGAAGGGSGGHGNLALLIVGQITGSNAVQMLATGGNGGNGSIVGTGVYANGGPGGHGGWAVVLYGSAATTPTASAAAGSSGTNVGAGFPALGTPVAGTSYVKRLT